MNQGGELNYPTPKFFFIFLIHSKNPYSFFVDDTKKQNNTLLYGTKRKFHNQTNINKEKLTQTFHQ